MSNVLIGISKFSNKKKKVSNHVLHMGNRIIEVFKKLKSKQKCLIRRLVSFIFLLKGINILRVVFRLFFQFYQLLVLLITNYLNILYLRQRFELQISSL